MSGPDATAGSIPIFLKNIGIREPTKLAITVVKTSEIPIQAEISKPKYGEPLGSSVKKVT